MALAGLEEPKLLRDWIALRYALLVRANSSAFVTPAQVMDEFVKRSKTYLIDEDEWGMGPDAVAGQAGMEALIAQQGGR